MMNKLAQGKIDLFENSGYTGFGKLGLETSPATNADLTFSQFISSAIGLITVIAIIWFVFTLFTGAISFITSGGDKAALETAKKKIVNALTGLIITIVGIFIIRFVGYLIGIPDILNFVNLFYLITK